MDQLGINLPGLIAQLINFTVLLVVLRLLLYKPILRMLDQRAARIREGLAASDEAKAQANAAEAEVGRQLDQARQDGQALVAQAQGIANRIQQEGRQQAEIESAAILDRARSEIQLERDSAIAELRREFADLTIAAAEKVIGQSLDRQAHQRLIDQALTDSSFHDRN